MNISTFTKHHTKPEIDQLSAFISTVFHDKQEHEEIFCTSHSESPTDNTPWPYYSLERIEDSSSLSTFHFCISTCKKKDGRIRRKNSDFAALHVIVLDDIGSKVKENSLKPSYIIETSEGNYQWGYVLKNAIRDKLLAQKIVHSIYQKDAKLTDTGGKIIMKLVKLPIGLNLKPGRDNFRVKLHELNTLQYEWEDFANAWNITLSDVNDQGEIKLPKNLSEESTRDELFEWLKENKKILSDHSGGYYSVACPWGDDHSDGDPKAGYSPLGLGEDPRKRQFKCHHEHGGNAPTTREFLMSCHIDGGPEVTIEGPPELFRPEHGLFDQPIQTAHFPDLKFLENGIRAKKTVKNLKFLVDWYGYEYYYDEIAKEPVLKYPSSLTNKNSDMQSAIYASIESQCQLSDWQIGANQIFSYMQDIIYSKPRNFVIEWLKDLEFDGSKDHIDILASTITTGRNTTDDLWKRFFKLWMRQCVAAVDCAKRTPNKEAKRKYESVLVLVGDQGLQKTKWWNSLVPKQIEDYFLDGAVVNSVEKDSLMNTLSNWIVEIGEIDATFRRSDISHLKAFLSQGKDRWRPPYGKTVNTYPRMTSFCASVNSTDFLHDNTGNRRFWAVDVSNIVLPDEQLVEDAWAQAWDEYLSGEKWWVDDQEETEELYTHSNQFHSMHSDSNIETILEHYGELTLETMQDGVWMTMREIFESCNLSYGNIGISMKVAHYFKSRVKKCDIDKVFRVGRANIKMYKMPPLTTEKMV